MEADIIKIPLQPELERRGIHKYLNVVQQFSDEDTDVEALHERKDILMTEMEHILEKLLMKEMERGSNKLQCPKSN